MNDIKIKTCCFTGHRPEKLNMPKEKIKEKLTRAIKKAIDDGFETFISGMARGIDMWSAEIVLEEKKNNPGIKLVCASPFEGFEKSWSYDTKEKYQSILDEADEVKFVCPHYSKSCFHIRNKYMVDNSQRVIAAYTGESGGTKNTVIYAEKKGIEVCNIFGEDYEYFSY